MSTPTTPTARVMPAQDEVRRVLSSLFGRPVTVTRIPAVPRGPMDKVTMSLFTQEDGTVRVVAMADLAFTAFAGASLTMIPAPMAERQAASGQIDEMVLENFREIMNILAGCFNGPSVAHVKLTDLVRLPKDKLAPGVDAMTRKPAARLDFTVQIPNYGTGKLSFLSA